MNYLSKEDLLDLHTLVVMQYGGRLGIASQDRLMHALDAPHQVLFHTELYPDIFSKAAIQTFLLLNQRPFISNNEGTALLAMLRFLEINGVTLREEIGSPELLWLIRAVSYAELDRNGIEQWLRDNTLQKVEMSD
jgi:death-on-curing protein